MHPQVPHSLTQVPHCGMVMYFIWAFLRKLAILSVHHSRVIPPDFYSCITYTGPHYTTQKFRIGFYDLLMYNYSFLLTNFLHWYNKTGVWFCTAYSQFYMSSSIDCVKCGVCVLVCVRVCVCVWITCELWGDAGRVFRQRVGCEVAGRLDWVASRQGSAAWRSSHYSVHAGHTFSITSPRCVKVY